MAKTAVAIRLESWLVTTRPNSIVAGRPMSIDPISVIVDGSLPTRPITVVPFRSSLR